jgi:cytochrome c peroxidase
MKKSLSVFLCLSTALLLLSTTIDLNLLGNYATQSVPNYINPNKNNTPANNATTDAGATLGRVLFYDKKLSLNNTVSCASCHQQAFAFSDPATVSEGFNGGVTGRHAMRLVNAKFAVESKFFWDERAVSLEDQTTHPIQDATEMGFSGTGGQPAIDSLLRKLEGLDYYRYLFEAAFGDATINEDRMQKAMAQFVRSIQSFDSKFDAGLAQTGNINANFPNFTAQENQGKAIFIAPPPNGAGCQGCHQAPEFDIDPNTLNNGVIGVAGSPGSIDLTNTRAPSLRDLFNPNGQLNGPLMHDASFTTIEAVINHYNLVPQNPANTNLDPRLAGPGGNLQLTQAEKNALAAFLRTLSGSNIYTDAKWSDPFDANGDLYLIPLACTDSIAANLIPSETTTYRAGNVVTSEGTVATGNTVAFRAGNSITLTEGFHAQAGCAFTASIEACTPNTLVGTSGNNTQETISETMEATVATQTMDMRLSPNPTTGTTKLRYYQSTLETPHIALYDLNGRPVLQLPAAKGNLGWQEIDFQVDGLPNGVYIVHLRTNTKSSTKKLVVAR